MSCRASHEAADSEKSPLGLAAGDLAVPVTSGPTRTRARHDRTRGAHGANAGGIPHGEHLWRHE